MQDNTKEKRNRLLILLALLLAAAVAIIVILCVKSSKSGKTGTETTVPEVTAAAAVTAAPTAPAVAAATVEPIAPEQEQGAFQAETVEPVKNITMPGWASITLAADTTEITSGVDFFNPEANEGYYDMTFELFADTENNGSYVSIYKSGIVYAGNHVQKITLKQALSAGTYAAYVHIQPYLKGDQSVALNSGDVRIELIVK